MDELGQHSSRSSVYLIIISFSLTAVFIAIYHLITKIYRRRRGADPQFPEFSRPASGNGLTVLAEASTVQLIAPAIIYKKGDAVGGEDGGVGCGGGGGGGGGRVGGIGEERTCPVCLSEFEEGDAVRVLPECRHCFHVECIDLWFRSHSTCPVCRSESLAV